MASVEQDSKIVRLVRNLAGATVFGVIVGGVQVALQPFGQRQLGQQVSPHMAQDDEPAEVLQRLHSLESGHRMQELHSHWAHHRQPVQEEQVAPGARVLDSLSDEVDDRRTAELLQRTEAEVACAR